MKTLLIVDDEPNMRNLLTILFERDQFRVLTAGTGEEAYRLIEQHDSIDLVLSDVRLPDINGVRILQHIHALGKRTPVVLVTAYGTISLAVEAMKQGAHDFVTKPFKKEFMRHVVSRVLNERETEAQAEHSEQEENALVIESDAMRALMNTVERISETNASVLITGESGVGKEVIARAIHFASRLNGPFVSISCPAIPDSLMESELFGHARGAFTGAARSYPGKLRQADRGTLMLDEVAELPLEVQPKLLRFLEERSFQPLGENRTVHVNTRLISATNRDLEQMINDSLFRKDLFYRINTITLEVPPLRERVDDILPLARRFLRQAATQRRAAAPARISPEVERILLRHDWPGNVRELRNTMEHVGVFSDGREVGVEDLPPKLHDRGRPSRPRRRMGSIPTTNGAGNGAATESFATQSDSDGPSNRFDAVERSLLLNALEHTGWNITAAARELGVSRNVVRYRIEKHGLEKGERRTSG